MSEYKIKTFEKNNIGYAEFISHVYGFYAQHRRSFIWRDEINPYRVFISEIMLQQTQTARVVDKVKEWEGTFPTFKSLASASFDKVLSVWKGLGYNRRALWVHQAAQKIAYEHGGILPGDIQFLQSLKGIGSNTAASIVTFAYNKPLPFIETNVRAVFITSFFSGIKDLIHDRDIMPLIEKTLDQRSPRDWYYALMDYGVHVKKQLKNPSRKSRHHVKQSRFEGSLRQVRSRILDVLLSAKEAKYLDLICLIKDNRIDKALSGLEKDGLIEKNLQTVWIK